MIVLTFIFVSLALFLCSVYWYQTRSRFAKYINKFPQLKPFFPIIGNAVHFSTQKDKLFLQFREALGRFDETTSLWGGVYGVVNIITAEDAEIILSSTKYIDKGHTYDFMQSWLGTGLLTSTGAKWHQRRKMLTPSFHFNILHMFVEVFGKHCTKLTEKLKEKCEKPKVDISEIVKELTLETICETSMGINLDKNNKDQAYYYDTLQDLGQIIVNRIVLPWLHSDLTYFLFPNYWKEKSLVKKLHKFTSDIIKKRQETFDVNTVRDLDSTSTKPKKNIAILDLLLYAKNIGQIADAGIREEVETFVFEGHDTTAAALGFTLMTLANHKDVQEKINKELDEIFGDSKRPATYDDLQNMKYLDRCLKECLRLYPSVPLIARHIKEDVQLTHYIAPAGSEVYVHIYNIHRNPKYYPDPEKFDPDRFLPENSAGRHPYAFIPFSAGPRNCIGQKYAMLELKSVVSSILRSFILDPIDSAKDLTWIMDLVLRVDGPINIKLKPRF